VLANSFSVLKAHHCANTTVVCKLQTMRPYRYLLLLTILISAFEKKRSDAEADNVDSLNEKFWTKKFKFPEYKVASSDNGYGKKLFIDSLNYKTYRGYFTGDSTKLIHEHYEDLFNDTAAYKEYYLNCMLKESSSMTYRNRIPIKKHRFYDKKGNLFKEMDYESNKTVNLDKAMKIAENEGMKKPFEIGVSTDSLLWEILVWKKIEFDSTINRGIEKGIGLSINRTNGWTSLIERKRRFAY
jgi:hypothetical protein